MAPEALIREKQTVKGLDASQQHEKPYETRHTQAQIRDLTELRLRCYRIAHKDEDSNRDTRRNILTTVTIVAVN